MRPHDTCLILVALTTSVATCTRGQDLQARLEKSLKDAGSISNLEIRVIDTLWEKDPAALKAMGVSRGQFSRTFEYSYVGSGQKYHATCRLISATETNVARLFESTFDGSVYVCYDADHRYMTKGHKPPPGERGELQQSPLIAPFMFLSRQSDDGPSRMPRFRDFSAPGFTNGLVLPKGQPSNGLLHISVPSSTKGKQPTLWNIAIDEVGDGFAPKTISRATPGSEIAYTLLSYTNLGTYRFPATIEWTASAYRPTSSPSLVATGMTTVLSVRMPEQVVDSTFHLDEARAETIWDSDQGKFAKSGPRSEASILQHPRLHDGQPQSNTSTATRGLHNAPEKE